VCDEKSTYMDIAKSSIVESKIWQNFHRLMMIRKGRWVFFNLVCLLASYECGGFLCLTTLILFVAFSLGELCVVCF